MNILHKWSKRFITLFPISISIISFGTVCYLLTQMNFSKSNNENDINPNFDNIYQQVQIFPQLNKYDFYDYIKIAQSKAIIDDKMIAQIINYIINHIQIPHGEIKYNFEKTHPQEVILTFEWDPTTKEKINKTYRKSYTFRVEHERS